MLDDVTWIHNIRVSGLGVVGSWWPYIYIYTRGQGMCRTSNMIWCSDVSENLGHLAYPWVWLYIVGDSDGESIKLRIYTLGYPVFNPANENSPKSKNEHKLNNIKTASDRRSLLVLTWITCWPMVLAPTKSLGMDNDRRVPKAFQKFRLNL